MKIDVPKDKFNNLTSREQKAYIIFKQVKVL